MGAVLDVLTSQAEIILDDSAKALQRSNQVHYAQEGAESSRERLTRSLELVTISVEMRDLVPVIEAHAELLGLGIDEATAAVVRGDRLEVIGRSVVGIYDGRDHDGKRYYFLSAGDQFDLKERRRLP